MNRLVEDSRSKLLSKSKKADNYAPNNQHFGKNRYERRLKSRVSHSVKDYNSINMNRLFKDNLLDVSVQVTGETDTYHVKITFGGFLDYLHTELERNNEELNLKVVSRALVSAFNSDDVYIFCSCLHPDTKIKLLDGTIPTVSEMLERFNNGEKLYVYSVDENGDFKPGEVEKVWVTKHTTDFVKVTLDNNEEILTTPDHLYMLRNGEYKQAQDLEIGQSLMPLYFSHTQRGYETVKLNSTNRYNSTYKIVANNCYPKEIQEALELSKKQRDDGISKMKYDVAIHHVDFNKSNNHPYNLKIMTSYDHWMYHSSLGWNGFTEETKENIRKASSEHIKKLNANPTENMKKARKEFTRRGVLRNYDEDRKLQQAEVMRKAMRDYYDNISEEDAQYLHDVRSKNSKKAWENGCFDTDAFKNAAIKRGEFLHTPEVEKLTTDGIRQYWNNLSDEDREKRADIARKNVEKATAKIRGSKFSEEHKQKISEARLNFSKEKQKEITTKTNLTKIRNQLLKLIEMGMDLTEENFNSIMYGGCPHIDKYFNNIDEAVSYFELNHKIIAIEYVTLEDTPVYDIKVKDYHNFLVDAGVILHNCADFQFRFSYWCSKNSITSGDPENRPSDITNPHDTKGAGCKHILLVLNNTSWLLKVASVIFNYINYMEKHYQRLYADVIYPAVYQKKYEEPVQMDIDDTDDLATDSDTLDKSNVYAKKKSQFQKGNEYRFRPNPNVDKQLDFDSLLDDEE